MAVFVIGMVREVVKVRIELKSVAETVAAPPASERAVFEGAIGGRIRDAAGDVVEQRVGL